MLKQILDIDLLRKVNEIIPNVPEISYTLSKPPLPVKRQTNRKLHGSKCLSQLSPLIKHGRIAIDKIGNDLQNINFPR